MHAHEQECRYSTTRDIQVKLSLPRREEPQTYHLLFSRALQSYALFIRV